MARNKEESEQLNAVCEYLTRKKWWAIRINNLPVYDAIRKQYRAMPKYAVKGFPDILALKNGEAVFIEMKSTNGKMSADQLLFEERVEKEGFRYFLMRSIDDAIYYGF